MSITFIVVLFFQLIQSISLLAGIGFIIASMLRLQKSIFDPHDSSFQFYATVSITLILCSIACGLLITTSFK